MTSMASIDGEKIDMKDALAEFGSSAALCSSDAPLYVLGIEDDGSLNGKVYCGAEINDTVKTQIDMPSGTANANVMVDYYVDLPGESVWEADITPDTFAGYYYVEADTLFRRQADGVDLPANLTFPNVKVQSNFTITMAGTGDPSSFDFTMDAFPGYTYFDKTKKVLCVLQIAEGVADQAVDYGQPVMRHNSTIEHQEPLSNDSVRCSE
jgi:hypothetical protein